MIKKIIFLTMFPLCFSTQAMDHENQGVDLDAADSFFLSGRYGSVIEGVVKGFGDSCAWLTVPSPLSSNYCELIPLPTRAIGLAWATARFAWWAWPKIGGKKPKKPTYLNNMTMMEEALKNRIYEGTYWTTFGVTFIGTPIISYWLQHRK